jgi:hypothetical protein
MGWPGQAGQASPAAWLRTALYLITLLSEHFQRHWVHVAARLCARAERLDAFPAEAVHDGLGHDAARGVARAEEEHL